MNKYLVFIVLVVTFVLQSTYAEPYGAVLYRDGVRYSHYNVPGNAEHHYFNFLEGPAWENKYSAFRMYIDKDDRNAVDIMAKYHPGPILQNFSDPTLDPHSQPDWGADVLSVGSAMGLGSFRLFNNGRWLNPQIPENLDSLVISITDSSVQTPEVMIGYYGWNIGDGNKITVFWRLATRLDERPTNCELEIIGNYTGKVVAGMVNHRENTSNPNRNSVKIIQQEDPPLLATLGRQSSVTEGFDDSLLMAIFAKSSYFDSFAKDGTTNLGMVLTPDDENKVRWSFAFSWKKEEDPLFRYDDWVDSLIPTTATTHKFAIEPDYSAVDNSVTTPSLVYMLNGRVYGRSVGTIVNPGQYSNGIYIVNRKKEGRTNGGMTHSKVNTLFSR